jgi:hypothetical protein
MLNNSWQFLGDILIFSEIIRNYLGKEEELVPDRTDRRQGSQRHLQDLSAVLAPPCCTKSINSSIDQSILTLLSFYQPHSTLELKKKK